MKKTLLLMAALFTLGSAAVSAQDEVVVDLSQDMFKTWSGVGADAVATGAADAEVNLGKSLNAGAVIAGTGSVYSTIYADLSEYTEIRVAGTSGSVLRFMLNRVSDNGDYVEKLYTLESGEATISITDWGLSFVHLNALKIPYNGSTGNVITSLQFVKPNDPLAVPKENLKNAISAGKLRSSYAKTTASWNSLQTAISEGNEALNSAAATAESLATAKGNIETAIAGLTLQSGYTDLTKEMFQKWSSQGAASGDPAETWTNAYVLYSATGQPYGDGSVDWLHYADLSAYDKLIVVVAAGPGRPRYCFNRTKNGGQDTDDGTNSDMIDIPNKTWGTAAYENIEVEGKVYTIDLKKMTKEQGFAYLHAIKTVQGNATISDMLLYKDTSITLTSSEVLEGYKTFYNAEQAYSVDDKTTIYKVVSLSEEKAIVEPMAGTIVPAATPVILKTLNDEDYKITLTPTAEASNDYFGDNLLEVAVPTFVPTGYVLGYTAADGIAFYGGQTIEDGDVYLPALVAVGGAKGRLSISFGGEATAINGVDAKSAQEGGIYNVAGQKVNAAYKGIVIKNGKKYLNK